LLSYKCIMQARSGRSGLFLLLFLMKSLKGKVAGITPEKFISFDNFVMLFFAFPATLRGTKKHYHEKHGKQYSNPDC
jgi:hypothetical protein